MERWRNITGYNGMYKVSNYGRVMSFRFNKKKLLKPGRSKKYLTYAFCVNRNVKVILAHRLVAGAFIPKMEGQDFVNHIDGDPTNNHVSNLEWVTHKENMIHAGKMGKMSRKGEKNKNSKLTEKEVLEIRELFKEGTLNQTKIAKLFGVHKTLISLICRRKIWNHV